MLVNASKRMRDIDFYGKFLNPGIVRITCSTHFLALAKLKA